MSMILRTYRRPLLAVALAAGLTVLLLSAGGAPVAADTKTGHDFLYYNDAAHDEVVGYRYYCIGNSGGWGVISPYSVENTYPCDPGER